MKLNWYHWSLMEFFAIIGVETNISGLKSSYDYIPKLSGWINRLIEIRERLNCSFCKETMKPNFEYAKNLAKYNVTVVSCSKGIKHDNNIYLNHCWVCRNIIDSRESRIQYENYYLCITCGSGPQVSETYSQGDICPKCGGNQTLPYDQYGRLLNCKNCNHQIKLPSSNKRTGREKKFQ